MEKKTQIINPDQLAIKRSQSCHKPVMISLGFMTIRKTFPNPIDKKMFFGYINY